MTGINHPQSSKESCHPTPEPQVLQRQNLGETGAPGSRGAPCPLPARPPLPMNAELLAASRPRACGLGRGRPLRPTAPPPGPRPRTNRCMASLRPPWHRQVQRRTQAQYLTPPNARTPWRSRQKLSYDRRHRIYPAKHVARRRRPQDVGGAAGRERALRACAEVGRLRGGGARPFEARPQPELWARWLAGGPRLPASPPCPLLRGSP